MNFSQIEAFVGLVKYRSFSKTAEALYISQPTISAQIRSLEEELETTLIIRSTKGIEVTDSGKKFFFYARDIIYKRDEAIADIKQNAHITKGIVNIAASSIPAMCIVPKALITLKERFPNIYPVIHRCNSSEIARTLTDLSCEVGISGAIDRRDGCNYIPLSRDYLVLITPNTEEYDEVDFVSEPQLISQYPFVGREPGSGTKTQYEDFFDSIGVDPKKLNYSVQLTDTLSVMSAVSCGLGIAIVSSLAAKERLKAGDIKIFNIQNELLIRNFYLVTRKNHRYSPEAKAFADIVIAQSETLGQPDFKI